MLGVEDIGPKWLYWPWVTDHLDDIGGRLQEHIELTVLAIVFGLVLSIPLALLSLRHRRLPVTGLSQWTALIPLTLYTLLILVRNIVTGFDDVPPEV